MRIESSSGNQPVPKALDRRTVWIIFPLGFLTMLPVTGVVPILRQLIFEYYDVGEFAASSFMSVNMIGALLGAPLLGWWADRKKNHLNLLVFCAVLDGLLWWLMTYRPPFAMLILARLLEGASHAGVMTMLMGLMGHLSEEHGRRARMAGMGGAIMFGIAAGSPLGGVLGKYDVLLPLKAGSAIMLFVACAGLYLAFDKRVARAIRTMGQVAKPEKIPFRLPKLRIKPGFRLPYLFGFVDRFTVGVFIIAFTMYAAHLGHDSKTIGFLIGAFMIPFAALSYPMGKLAETLGLWRFVLAGSWLFGLAYAGIPWISGGWLWVNMGVCGVLSAVMFGPNLMLVAAASSPENRASAMAGFNAAGAVGFLLGPLLAGALFQVLKNTGSPEFVFRVVFACAGGTEILCVAWGVYRLRTSRDPR